MSPINALPAHGKLLALLGFVLAVVATPVPAGLGDAGWAPYGFYLALIAAVLAAARLAPGQVARRALVETPFLAFAALMPFVAAGARVQVGPLSLSESGLIGGAALVAKATLGVLAAIALASTTPARELLLGLERLRLPGALVAIVSFMIRYVGVVTGDAHRMRVAREARGATGGAAGHLAAVAGGAGTLFVRSYERGERVHLAMLARGYDGSMPGLHAMSGARGAEGARGEWASRRPGLLCAALPGAALIVLVASRMMGT